MLGEQLKDKKYMVEYYIKETISTMILAVLGSQEEESRRAIQLDVIRDAL
jgi:hypothetical protein